MKNYISPAIELEYISENNIMTASGDPYELVEDVGTVVRFRAGIKG